MLISHGKKFIYTKSVKTASTSVEVYFEKYCLPEEGQPICKDGRKQIISDAGIVGARGLNIKGSEWVNHMSAAEIKEKIGNKIWKNYFKFCVIRNPYDRLISLYLYSLEKGRLNTGTSDNSIMDFSDFILNGNPYPGRKHYSIDSVICVDYLIRFEELGKGIKFVCDQLGLPFEPENIPKLKVGSRDKTIPVSNFYTKETREWVRRVYRWELDEFGYEFPG